MIQKNFKNILLFAIIIGTIIILFEFNKVQNQLDRTSSNLMKANIENQEFSTRLTEANTKIAEQEQIIVSKDEAIASGLVEIEGLKKLKSSVNFESETKIQNVQSVLKDLTPEDVVALELDSISPQKFKRFELKDPDNWYYISGVTSKDLLIANDIIIRNKYRIQIADKKMGFFRKSKPIVQLENFNPYSETTKMSNVVINYSQPFYKKWWFWLITGFTSATLLLK